VLEGTNHLSRTAFLGTSQTANLSFEFFPMAGRYRIHVIKSLLLYLLGCDRPELSPNEPPGSADPRRAGAPLQPRDRITPRAARFGKQLAGPRLFRGRKRASIHPVRGKVQQAFVDSIRPAILPAIVVASSSTRNVPTAIGNIDAIKRADDLRCTSSLNHKFFFELAPRVRQRPIIHLLFCCSPA